MSGEKLCKEALAVLRLRLPTAKAARLVFYDEGSAPKGTDGDGPGYCRSTKRMFVIGVKREKCHNCMLEALIHEYAHARAWGSGQAASYDHDGHWGIELGRVYQEFTGMS